MRLQAGFSCLQEDVTPLRQCRRSYPDDPSLRDHRGRQRQVETQTQKPRSSPSPRPRGEAMMLNAKGSKLDADLGSNFSAVWQGRHGGENLDDVSRAKIISFLWLFLKIILFPSNFDNSLLGLVFSLGIGPKKGVSGNGISRVGRGEKQRYSWSFLGVSDNGIPPKRGEKQR